MSDPITPPGQEPGDGTPDGETAGTGTAGTTPVGDSTGRAGATGQASDTGPAPVHGRTHRGETSPHDSLTTPPGAVLDGYFWERRRRSAVVPIAVGVLGLTALGLIQELPIRHGIEQDLTDRSARALQDAGVDGVRVQFSGRDGTLTGTVAGTTERDSAIAAVRHVTGVRVAHDHLRLTGRSPGQGRQPGGTPATPPRSAPEVTARLDGTRLVLSGTVPTGDDRARLVSAARAAVQAERVSSRLSVDRAVSDAGLDRLPAVLRALGRNATATVSLSGGRVTLTGTVASARQIRQAVAAATVLTGDRSRVTDRLSVDPAATVAAALRALDPVTFRTGYSTPTVRDEAILRRLAAILAAHPGVRIEIDGHTDDVGTTLVNDQLSAARARTVGRVLRGLGVDGSRLTYRAFGERHPKLPNTSAANRAANRRVEFRVLH